MKFAPLHIISSYTFLASGLTIDKIVSTVNMYDYYGAAITDKNCLSGVPFFANAMAKKNRKFVVGSELTFGDNFVSLFAINEDGYKNSIFIINEISKNSLNSDKLSEHTSGLVAVLDTNAGYFLTNFNEGECDTKFTSTINKIAKLFDEFYLGLDICSKETMQTANKIREFANKYAYSTIAFPRILYPKKDDAISLEIVKAIESKTKLTEKEKIGSNFFTSEANYEKIYTKDEILNTSKIVDENTLDFFKKRGELLSFPGVDAKIKLEELAYNGLKEKGLENNKTYLDRLKYELEIINSMGYADYFLIVSDYVNWARNNNIVVGPGRGSACGCLVSHLIGITIPDPIKYNLQFERFLNPARRSMPDIDIDFLDSKRKDVTDYLRKKYGNEHVAIVGTYQTILCKQAIRDAGKVYDFPDLIVDNLCKAVGDKDLTLADCYRKLPAFKNYVDSDPYYSDLVKLASKIEGMPRNNGEGAAGVVLTKNELGESLPIFINIDNNYVSQYDKKFLEKQGFLKMDLLSITTLRIIDECVKLINKNHNLNLNPNLLDYDNQKTYDLIASGQTMGIFQLENAGMRKAIKKLKPTCFDDVAALLALYRPATMADVEEYADRKHGLKKPIYYSKELENVLSPTYGIIVYQEQVNSIVQVMAGFSPSEADIFRKAISDKDSSVFVELEKKFVQGALKHGYKQDVIKAIYNKILLFSGYGLNKSHSVAYAMITCETAYLKANFPDEFYTIVLTIGTDAKLSDYATEIKNRGLKLLLPNINKSEFTYKVTNEGIYFPLSNIYDIHTELVENIIEDRKEHGEFKDFFNFALRMYPRKLSESNIKGLINAGCFDDFGYSRKSLLLTAPRAIQFAKLNCNSNGSLSLTDDFLTYPKMIIEDDDPMEKLELEYKSLKIMLSANPMTYKKDLLKKHNCLSLDELEDEDKEVYIGGAIKKIKTIKTKKGLPMAFVTIYDENAEAEVTVFSDLYAQVIALLETNNILLVKGQNRSKDGKVSFIASDISLLD